MTEEEQRDDERDRIIESQPLDSLSLQEAVSIVGEETRARIMFELGQARGDDGTVAEPLEFSELMARVGVEDSGRFNYHLEKLVDTFVEKRDEGYVLRLPGQLFHEAIVAGTLTERPTVEPFPVGDCPECDDPMSAVVTPDHVLAVECEQCETLAGAVHFPARGLEGRTPDEQLDAAIQRQYHELAVMRRGICRGCGGRIDRGIVPDWEGPGGCCVGVRATLSCRSCGAGRVAHPAYVGLTTPPVFSFFAEHGQDPARVRPWGAVLEAASDSVSVRDTGVSITYERDTARLDLRLDDALQVVE